MLGHANDEWDEHETEREREKIEKQKCCYTVHMSSLLAQNVLMNEIQSIEVKIENWKQKKKENEEKQ